jgi:hypothetical protein
MCSHGRAVINPDIHPRGPIGTSRSGTLAEAHFLASQKTYPVRILRNGEERLLQRWPSPGDLFIV